jgi:aminopeptidase N
MPNIMRTEEARAVRLSDYRPPDWLVETVHLDFKLDATRAPVRATIVFKPNPAAGAPAPLKLDGDGLTLVSLKLDGETLPADRYAAAPDGLTIPQPPNRAFTLEIETLVDPTANTQLSGLYRASGAYCTQCEAEGFRRITYFPDRPDVMAVYTTRIEADKSEAPVLLANGNLTEHGDLPNGRHFAVWHDPWPKPSYLFALVGGKLGVVEDSFTTMSGRKVVLRIYVEPGKEKLCGFAMDSLKRSMRWDEQAFGREYDLDIFMIVAVSHFNMGAMENKGLNVFNDKYVLASPDTATDQDFVNIEAIIAHEYFHNWTGNRITCRDWFQLCLKEGLTVFRDQEFTSDERSRVVARIGDVRGLRTVQFTEDAGPLAHPVRPELYREINNFYTSTVYDKGAEVVRMIKTLIGPQLFRQGMDLYFERHDGEAATIEQFVQCFADASGRDFKQFMRWYSQAGTPEIAATSRYDAAAKTYRLDVAQTTRPTPGQPTKEPQVVPLGIGLVGKSGDLPLKLAEGLPPERGVLVLDKPSQSFTFTGVTEQPVLSINRGFSAPVRLDAKLTSDDLRTLAARDSDPFNRWQAVQTLATGMLTGNVARLRAGQDPEADEGLLKALAAILADASLEPAFIAEALQMPNEADIAREIGKNVDPDAIFRARTGLRALIGLHLNAELTKTYRAMTTNGPYTPDAASAGRRALKNISLDLLAATAESHAIRLAAEQFKSADNMTDRMAALATLNQHDGAERIAALEAFFERYRDDALTLDKWFGLEATAPHATTLARVRALTAHPAFSMSNPNRVRSLITMFAVGNQTQFNRADGAGYEFIADTVLALDPANPQVAARMLSAFKSWRMLEPVRRGHAEAALRRVAAQPNLSRDASDIAQRALADA